MNPVQFIMVGGFLGAGKTTALTVLARRFLDAGRRVGLITNDQSADLVDTGLLRAGGLPVAEVAGGCFCCRFEDLAEAAGRLRAEQRPEVLLAEPVGSCTDLVATVVKPMQRLYGDAYRFAPYSVLLDPLRAERIFLQSGFGGFSSKVVYIYRKQLEEADAIVVNKIDRLDDGRCEPLIEALESEFPGKRILRMSAISGEGIEAWAKYLESGGESGGTVIDVDYDLYAEGEAELGWLNATVPVRAPAPFCADRLVLDLISRLAERLTNERIEPAHLKVLFSDETGIAVANLVQSGVEPGLSSRPHGTSRGGTLTVNARVHAAPETLRRAVEETLRDLTAEQYVDLRVERATCFSPARPVPNHRDRPTST